MSRLLGVAAFAVAHFVLVSSATAQDEGESQDHLSRGVMAASKQNYSEAIAEFSEAIRLNPQDFLHACCSR